MHHSIGYRAQGVGALWRLLTLGGLVIGFCANGYAQSAFPSRTIKLVVPLAAGGTADLVPRMVADKLPARWGESVIVENRPGAGHTIGADAVAKAPPDGHTLLVTPQGPLVTSQLLYSKLSYDPTAFVPVSILTTGHIVLIANPKIPASTLSELVVYAKANPGRLRYASPGAGSSPHMTGEMLKAMTGIQTTHVPYRGLAPAVTDLLAGHVDIMFDNLGNSIQYLKDGRLKVLAIAGPARIPELPHVAAVAETFRGFESTSWFAMVAPPNTPSPIVDKLSLAVADILREPDIKKRLHDLSLTPVGSTPEQTRDLIRREAVRWREAIGSSIVRVQVQ
jgi:tripartite-type tricarboxylate transporter receptor subunit TctC